MINFAAGFILRATQYHGNNGSKFTAPCFTKLAIKTKSWNFMTNLLPTNQMP